MTDFLAPHDIVDEVWYRFEDFRWAPHVDEYDEIIPGSSRADVTLREFPVVRHTPKGVVIRTFDGERLVLHDWRKKFACETEELAKENFLARKAAQKRILQNKIDHVDEALQVFAKKYGGDE